MSIFLYDTARTVIVDSKNRISGKTSNFVIQTGIVQTDAVCDRIALKQITIPKSWYDVPNGLNTFKLKVGASESVMSIPYGNYTIVTLDTAIKKMFTDASLNISFVYSPLLNKFQCNNNTGAVIQFEFERGMAHVMGFEKGSKFATNSYGPGAFETPNCIFLSTVTKLYLQTSMCDTSDFLQEIIVCPLYPGAAMIFYENGNYDVNSRTYTGAMHTSHNFRLLDSYGQVVDLNGIDLTFTLVIYKRNNVAELQSEDIRLRQLTEFSKHSKDNNYNDDAYMR